MNVQVNVNVNIYTLILVDDLKSFMRDLMNKYETVNNIVIGSTDLYNLFVAWAKENNINVNSNVVAFMLLLKKHIPYNKIKKNKGNSVQFIIADVKLKL
jgi:hypothetical protein